MNRQSYRHWRRRSFAPRLSFSSQNDTFRFPNRFCFGTLFAFAMMYDHKLIFQEAKNPHLPVGQRHEPPDGGHYPPCVPQHGALRHPAQVQVVLLAGQSAELVHGAPSLGQVVVHPDGPPGVEAAGCLRVQADAGEVLPIYECKKYIKKAFKNSLNTYNIFWRSYWLKSLEHRNSCPSQL